MPQSPITRKQQGETLKKIRLWKSTLVAAAFAVGSLGIAAPATAGTITLPCNQNFTGTIPAGDNVVFNTTGCSDLNLTSVGGAANVTVTDQNGNALVPGNINLTGITAVVVSRIAVSATFTFSSGATLEGQITLSPGPANPSDTNTPANTPIEVSLSLDLAASGATCKSGSAATGLVGTWLTLPSADDCTSTTRSDAKLLGWSTSKDFPVAIAQRQVDNGWGAYEMTNESGRVTAVFIPAGRATFVSGSNSLYPIWAR